MKLTVEVDIDLDESGLIEDDVKDRIIDFTMELLCVGAEELSIALTLNQITYET